ncbi:unnamed protein product [Leptosia nina]|uniref:CCDC174 alpha/beta GRSR domain-containing protein n=1 Tax=Leptosia nina TaxID=320188 RepID=A0AAV1JB23_9NEOP
MNEQSSKKITFSKSTLFSLKAELLRKQEEVLKKKDLPQHKLENFTPAKATDKNKHENSELAPKQLKDKLKAVDIDELEALRKSKSALEKKAELYKHLSDGAGQSELTDRFLVDFKEKKEKGESKLVSDQRNIVPNVVPITNNEDSGEWVVFTDCLGRSRKCLQSDLELYRQRDKELMRLLPGYEDEEKGESEQSSSSKEQPFLVQKTKDYLQSLRQKWEEKEKELLAKDKDIHYQDVLFDEARMHGVGYYSFSTDEAERKKQMEDLLKEREKTLKAQKHAEEIRKKRDELVAARVAAAKARQRMRAGLPPEDPEEKKNEFTKCLLEFLNEKKNEADTKAKEEEKRLKEEREKERQKEREAYIREWDVGKEGVEGKVKKFRELTQEEYVEQQRSKRINEFAPLEALDSRKSNLTFDQRGHKIVAETSFEKTVNKTWDDVRKSIANQGREVTPPPPTIGEINEQKGLFFTSKKHDKSIKYKNFVKADEPTPIQNELSDEDEDIRRPSKRKNENNAEIPPPPTYEYYGPVPKTSKSKTPFNSDIREAFAQGTKSLESKSNGIHLSSHYDFTFD